MSPETVKPYPGFRSNATSCAQTGSLVYIPSNLITVTDATVVRQVLRLVEILDDLDDVKAVHANYDIDGSLLTTSES